MGFTLEEGRVRVDLFKPSGKWHGVGSVLMSDYYHHNPKEALELAMSATGIDGWTIEWRDWVASGGTIVCLEPYTEHSYPVTVCSPENQDTITAWANSTFGKTTSNMSSLERAEEEWDELTSLLVVDDKSPDAGEELADVIICLSRLASGLGISIVEAVNSKMAINRTRRWKKTGDGHGRHY